MSPNRAKRTEKYKTIQQDRLVWDRDYGGVYAQPWKVLKSAGYDVLQIDTRPGLMYAERSEEDPA